MLTSAGFDRCFLFSDLDKFWGQWQGSFLFCQSDMFFPGLEIGLQSLVSWVDVECPKSREELCANFGSKVIFGKYEGGLNYTEFYWMREDFMSWSWYEAKERWSRIFQGILTLGLILWLRKTHREFYEKEWYHFIWIFEGCLYFFSMLCLWWKREDSRSHVGWKSVEIR